MPRSTRSLNFDPQSDIDQQAAREQRVDPVQYNNRLVNQMGLTASSPWDRYFGLLAAKHANVGVPRGAAYINDDIDNNPNSSFQNNPYMRGGR